MNITILSVQVFVLFFILCHQSEQRRYFRTPSGRKANIRLPDGSVKGGSRVQHGLPVDDSDGLDDDECEKYGQPTKEVIDSYGEITRTPDRDMTLDLDVDHNSFCEREEKSFKIFEKHGGCLKGSKRKYYVAFLKTMEKAVQRRCNSKAWFERCLTMGKVNADIQQCAEKLYRTFDAILKNTPKRKQAEKICCIFPHYLECIGNVTEVCEKEDKNFIVQTLGEPFSGVAPILCEKDVDAICDEKTKNTMNNVFSKNYVHRHLDNYKLVFDMFENLN